SPREVLKTYVRQHSGNMVTITVGRDKIEATGDHPFWVVEGRGLDKRPKPRHAPAQEQGSVVNGRWVNARDLVIGDVLLPQSGETARVEALSIRADRLTVYNFTVAGLHNYAVGGSHILVHNPDYEGGHHPPGWDNNWQWGPPSGERDGAWRW